jgi:alpha-tubulin suppressor-like RCC1 family protein
MKFNFLGFVCPLVENPVSFISFDLKKFGTFFYTRNGKIFFQTPNKNKGELGEKRKKDRDESQPRSQSLSPIPG